MVRCLPIQEARLIRRYQEQMLMAGIVVKSCHTALQTFSCLLYQFSVCVAPLVYGPLAQATCCFLKRIANNLLTTFYPLTCSSLRSNLAGITAPRVVAVKYQDSSPNRGFIVLAPLLLFSKNFQRLYPV